MNAANAFLTLTSALLICSAIAAPNPHPVHAEIIASIAEAEQVDHHHAGFLFKREQYLSTKATLLSSQSNSTVDGGHWIDRRNGKLIVAIKSEHRHRRDLSTDPDIEHRFVARSTSDLEDLKSQVDAAAQKHQPTGVTWYVDVPANNIAVSIWDIKRNNTNTDVFINEVSGLGPGINLIHGSPEIKPRFGILDGEELTSANFMSCSMGWWVKDGSGADLLMSAGHCLKSGGHNWFRNALLIGGNTKNNFGPMDWGIIHVDDIAAPRPTTQITLHNGKTLKISGYGRAPIGATVCKSGTTTKYTCGPVKAYDATANYQSAGVQVKGMTLADVCTRPGDSGGPLFQPDPNRPTTHAIAQGIVSGGPTEGCANSIYQPIDTALTDSQTILITSTD
ncbi:uncharacterized protein SPPG_07426 [Spizellomyces punctatus DAOM BR117]|uniref:Peptidase S1 domain-containing protein n=1 Tax=Spizellomyces punctatus (strain DAOM BR117) TaxID=645134 RepID=A0A0L0H7X2_SPIPD|nr:uncharacterized protein SPPG_07426 [Spizellomyces punctatus DAOM BR117]KNC97026.1 hypothetical protein SPPG_07426 [Spizellomyces punctatus DAOM BR117]|eukprot:XP_016605066.1 hypothetical protein SPPG_07426 [Spizellomyces punctatus DAOM BR117]